MSSPSVPIQFDSWLDWFDARKSNDIVNKRIEIRFLDPALVIKEQSSEESISHSEDK